MPILPTDPPSGGGAATGEGASAIGTATFTADGLKLVFNIPHGLGVKPAHGSISALSMLGAGDKYLSYDTTNIIITFAVAPTSGTMTFSWGAFK